jgi:TRAP-type C4-dicarboxylate transport system permease small subunit
MAASGDMETQGAATRPLAAGTTEIARVCEFAVAAALLAMVLIIAVDVFARSLLGFSLQMSDEMCGYLLVAATFLSVPVSLAHDGFHHVELIQARLTPRGRLISRLGFDVLALVVCTILDWQFIRLELSAWNSGAMAPSVMMTPLWIPQLSLPLGMSLVCLLLIAAIISKVQQLKSPGTKPAAQRTP